MENRKDDERITKLLSAKKEQLERIIYLDSYPNPELHDRHNDRIAKAKDFLEELKEVNSYLDFGLSINVVPLSVYNRQLEKSDFATIEFDGIYCKIAIVQSFPSNEKFWLVYMASIEQI